MKKFLTILFSILIAPLAYAQDVPSGLNEAKKGPVFSTSRKSNFSGFIGKNSNTLFSVDYLSISRKKQELSLRRYSITDLELVDTRELFSVIDDDFYNEPSEVYFQDNTIYLFSTLSGLKKKFNLVYLEIFNEYGEKLNERILDTLELDEQFYIAEAEEKKGFLIATHNKFDNIFEQTIHLTAINTLGETAWQEQLKSPVSLQNLKIVELRYSINAPLYILCDYGFDLNNGSVREDNADLIKNKYSLWGYDPKTKFMKEFDLRIKNRWIYGITMNYNKNMEMVLGGFMNETRNRAINGVFAATIDSNMTISNSSYYKYKKGLYEKFVDPKRLDKTKELEDIQLRNCIVLEDNSYFLLGEHYYQYTERMYDPRTNITTTVEHYNYNSILVAYFDANGNHVWSDRIPKFQHTENDYGYYSSFSVMQYKNEIYLFFNDNERNNEIGLQDYFNYNSLSLNRRFQISYVRIGEEGVKTRGPIIAGDNNFLLRAKPSYQIVADMFYLYSETGKSKRVFGIAPK